MKVLVTGGGGFLGRYVVEAHLKRGDQVRSLSRRRYAELDELGVDQVQADLGEDRDSLNAACEGIDVVQHTAAIAGIFGRWETFYRANTIGTENLLRAAKAAGVERFVFTSSPSVTFAGESQEGIDESVGYPAKFNCHYPHSKALAERAVLAANEPGKFATCALRPHLIWGPRDQHLIPRLIERAKSGQLRRVGRGDNLIDMIFVENAAEAQVLAADALAGKAAAAGKAYFLSQGEPVNCWDWINEILQLADLPPLKRGISFRAAWLAGALLEGAYRATGRTDEPRMTRFLAAQLALPHYFDISAAREDLGYRPTVSSEEGMRRLSTWMSQSVLS